MTADTQPLPAAPPVFRHVAIVGAGLMGRGIGIEYALGGSEVALLASSAASSARALERAAEELHWLVQAGAVPATVMEGARGRLRAARDLQDAAAEAELVVESIPEQVELKQEVFEALDQMTRPSTVLASNTSGIPITALAARARHPERILGTHYWNPPHLMPLVELVRGERTSEETLQRVEQALRQLGKRTIRVRREVPGFIWNRLQMALLREALWLVENGVATPEEIDLSVRMGLGRRYSGIGLFEAVDLGGLASWHSVASRLFPELSTVTAPGPFLTGLHQAGRLGVEAGAGVYDWPASRAQEVRARRTAHLLEWLRRDRAAADAEGGSDA